MKKAWSLTKVYLSMYYGLSGLINDFKTNKKQAFKKISLGILIILSFFSMLPMVIAYNLMLYKGLKTINQQGLIITNSIITAVLFTLVFGFLGVITTYFIGKERDILFSLPIKPWNLLFARFFINYLSEVLIITFITLPPTIIYGIKEGPGFIFYIAVIMVILFVPIIPLAICYFILIPIMKFGNFLKNKDVMMIFTGFIGIAFAIAIQFFSRSMTDMSKNPMMMVDKIQSPNGLVSIVGKIYYPSIIATRGILGYNTLSGWLNIFFLIIISIFAVLLLIYIMSGYYFRSNLGSEEVRKSKKKLDSSTMKQELKRRSTLGSMVLREIRLMNREPVYFLNGPLVILLMPFIIISIVLIQGENFGDLTKKLYEIKNGVYYLTLALCGGGVFLGLTGTPSSSAISREGKAFMQLKSMPINPIDLINAKLIHGIIIGAIGSLVTCVMAYFIIELPMLNYVIAFIISIIIMLPVLIGSLMVELRWPKLTWDDPIKAMKQNINVVVMVLGEMFIYIPLIGFIAYKFLENPTVGYVILFTVPLIISSVLYRLLIKYSQKRFYQIEI